MYFDDAHITDWISLGPSARWAFATLNELLGTPFAEEKKQLFSTTGTFLGLDFDFSEVPVSNCVSFWARERLLNKATAAITLAKDTSRFTPAQAAKLDGLLNFLESGMFEPSAVEAFVPSKIASLVVTQIWQIPFCRASNSPRQF